MPTNDATRLAASLAVGVALLLPDAALAQTAPSDPAAVAAPAAKEEPAEAQVPAAGAPLDPLTPPKAVEPVPLAPGADKVAAPKAAPAAEADPIVGEVRRILGPVADKSGSGEKGDRAALTAHYAESEGKPIWTSSDGLSGHGKAVIEELRRAADYGLDPAAFDIPGAIAGGAPVSAIADAEIRIGLAVLKYARHARGGRVSPSSLSAMIDREPRLYDPRSVLVAIAASDEAGTYLRELNPRHDGFARLRKALLAVRGGGDGLASLGLKAGQSHADTERRILINMERWRWMPDDMGEFHVWDNVPEQITRVIRDGKTVLTEKIVVGKPSQQTPEFSAPMKFVIFHPSWGVPDGIKTNELAPLLRRASANNSFFFGDSGGASRALARHELKVFQNGRPVNPDSVNWQSVDIRQFSFSQPPSGKNVLGIVKFRFPNKFDVYMHDTPERHLFNTGTRAFSHGCMRVQNPMKLAQVILDYDKGWSADKVNGFVGRGGTTDITLEKQVPVHITYFTAAVDDDGKLRQFGDIYGRDSRVASALAGKAVSVAPVAGTPSPDRIAASETGETAAANGKKGKQEKAGRVKAAKSQGGLSFDPFSGLSAN